MTLNGKEKGAEDCKKLIINKYIDKKTKVL
jgi:hypothetical protein